MQDCLHSMLNDVKQSQKLSRPSCDPSDVIAPFCMDSPYPPSQFVRAFAHSTYRYPYLRTMWLQFCRCRGLACWIDILPSTIRCFLPWLLKLTNYLWNLLYYIPHVQKPTAPYTHRQYKATLHMLTRSLHIALGVDMELHAPLNHHSVLPYMHIPAADTDTMDWYVSPWSFLQAKRYVNCICYRPYLHNTTYNIFPAMLQCLLYPSAPARFVLLLTPDLSVHIPNWCLERYASQLTYSTSTSEALWLFQNPLASILWPINTSTFTAITASPLKHIGHKFVTLPTHICMPKVPATYMPAHPPVPYVHVASGVPAYVPPCDGKQFFWHVWNTERLIRQDAFENLNRPNAWTAIQRSVTRCIPILPYAPMAHIRKLLCLVDWAALKGMEQPGQWLYASFSPLLTAIYYGQTGVISRPRTVFARWREELQQAMAWAKLQHTSPYKGPLYFRTLHTLGFFNFLPIPVKMLSHSGADRIEQQTIANNPPTLNTQKRRSKGFIRWLVRHKMLKTITQCALMNVQFWDHQLSLRRLTISGADALKILVQAKGVVPAWKFHVMQTRFFPLINRHFHIDMPYFLLLRIPCITALDVMHIKKWFADFIHATTLPRILKQYLHKILIVPLCHPHKLSQTFTQDRLQLSIADYQNYVTAHSHEDNFIATGPEIVTPQHPTPLTQLLHAPLNHTIIPASVTAHRRLAEHLESLKSQLPKAAPFPFTQFAAKVHTLLTSTLQSSSVAQSCIRTATLKSFQHTFPELLPVRVDKYPLLYAVATIVTFYRLILYVFTQAVNYRHLFTCRSPTRARNVLLLYYNLCVRVYPEILNHLSPLRLRNTLSLQVPTLKGISIKTPLLPVPSHPITPQTLCTVKNILLHDAQQQMHLTDNILYAPPIYPYGHRHTKQVYPPSVILSIKGKSLPYQPTQPIADVATREIFSNGAHPWKRHSRIVSRAASVACRLFQSSFFSLQILTQQQLVTQFLRPAQQYFSALNVDVAGFELDLKRMFPSLDRSMLRPAYTNLFDRCTKMYCYRRTEKDIYISVAHGSDSQLDCIGKKSPKYYSVFSSRELVDRITLDAYLNDLFQIGSDIFEQYTGVAIGAQMASQNANVILMHAESTINWDARLPQHTKLCRYVDNVVGLCPKHNLLATVQRVKRLLTEIYRVPLTVEQLGTSFNTLQLQISCVGPEIHWGMKNKVLLSCLTPRIPVSRYPDVHSLHAARIVHGMAVNLVNLASILHTHPVLFVSNCAHIVWEFLQKTYPLSWWMPVVRRAYSSYSDLPLTWNQFLDELPWVVPCPPKYCLLQSASLLTTTSLKSVPTFSLTTSILPPVLSLKHMELLVEKTAPVTYLPRVLWYSTIFSYIPYSTIYQLCTTAKYIFVHFWFHLPLSLVTQRWPVFLPLCRVATKLCFAVPSRNLAIFYMFLLRTWSKKLCKGLTFLMKLVAHYAISPLITEHKVPQLPNPPIGGKGRQRAAKRCRFLDVTSVSDSLAHTSMPDSRLQLLEYMADHPLPKRRCRQR